MNGTTEETAGLDRHHVPDILDCLAQLSNDKVPTPPDLARAMLDLLPGDVWSGPDLRFLDPCSKSGVFLREIVKRLLVGLEAWEPDFSTRREHIFRNMVWGTSIDEVTGIISRRTLYYSHNASGPASVISFENGDGNLPFIPAEHDFQDGRCSVCRAPESIQRPGRENYAYSFIHGAYPTEEMSDMKFDVIVGNPPYQLDDEGHNMSATPVYQHFVNMAKELDPRYLVMITPSRWFSGGKYLDQFREEMLADRHIRTLVDNPKLYDCFPNVKIRGGVSYFLRDREYDGPCSVQTMWEGKPVGPAVERDLSEFDVLVRRNEAVGILRKVRGFKASGRPETTLDGRVSARKPFGFPTDFHGRARKAGLADPIKLFGSQKTSWIDRAQIEIHSDWIDEWKVLTTKAQGTSAAVETKFLSNPIVAEPGEVCSETYLVAGRFNDASAAHRYAAYLRTRFVRFLISLRKPTQDATRKVFGFVPDLPLDREWTDALLYERYGLNDEEISFIESHIAEMPADEAVTA